MKALKQMLLLFFHPSDFNMSETGVQIPQGSGDATILYADFHFFMEDEKAAKVNLDIKGASGLKVCALECMNVVGATAHPPAGDYFVRFDEPDRLRWHLRTKATFRETLAYIERSKITRTSLKRFKFEWA